MASGLSKAIRNVATSRFESLTSSVSWRDEIDNYRELEKWDEALDMYRRSGKERDNAIEVLVLGQRAFAVEDYEVAKKHWNTLTEAENTQPISKLEAHALLGILYTKLKEEDKAQEHFDKVCDFLRNMSENVLRDQTFAPYRFSVLTELLVSHAKTQGPLEASSSYELVKNSTIKFNRARGTLCEKARRHYEDALFQGSLLTLENDDERLALQEWRNSLSSPVKCSEKHQLNVLKKIAEVCLYYFQCNPAYPQAEKVGNSDVFVPNSATEEAALALFLIENKTPNSAFDSRIYDDLLLCLGTNNALSHAIKSMERAVAFKSEDDHLWTQFVLCLLEGGKEKQAFAVIQQMLEVNPKNVMMLLLGAKICINHLNNLAKAAEYCSMAVKCCNDDPKAVKYFGRAYHYFGVCYSALALNVYSTERTKIHTKALEYFQQASISGCCDYLFLFHYALEHAETRNIVEAKRLVQLSMELNEDFAPSWILLVLLLTSQKLYLEAADICETATMSLDDANLYYCTAAVNLHLKRYDAAMKALNKICEKFNTASSQTNVNSPPPVSHPSMESLFSPRSRSYSEDLSESRTSVSQISEGSSVKVPELKMARQRNVTAYDAWILLSQVFSELGQYGDSAVCLDKADEILPYHPDTSFRRGTLSEATKDREAAIQHYKEALGCDPNHEQCILHLAHLFLETDVHEAESYAMTAVRKFPFSARGWFILGKTLAKLEDSAPAGSCMKLSLELEATTPLIPFSYIKREL